MSDPRRGRGAALDDGLELQPFLEAQRIRPAATVEELKQANGSVGGDVIKVLGSGKVFETWVLASNDLEHVFLDEAEGVLGKRLIELAAMEDEVFAEHRVEAEAIVKQTAVAASRMYPLVHRLQMLAFASTREEVVERLSRGDLHTQVRVEGVSIVPVRETLIGTLRNVDRRLGANIWSLEYAPEFPATAVVADPFDATSGEIADLWRDRILAKGSIVKDREHTILSISGDITGSLSYELERIHERAEDPVVREAAQTVALFLEQKSIYYQDPDPRDFELYHFGKEQPDRLMNLFEALDTIKHADPELFLEMLGIHPEDGGRSPLFGSFLHKALYNTQRVVQRTEMDQMALGTMMRQLLTMDEHVKTYAGVVSQEALKAMAGEMRKAVDAQPDATSKAQQLLMMAGPYMTMTIDAEIKRQLDKMREASGEKIHAELVRLLDDVEHPLKAMDYIGSMPLVAFEDETIQLEFRKRFEIDQTSFTRYGVDSLQNQCRERRGEILRRFYQRTPLIDETRPDLGFALRIRVAIRDALRVARPFQEFTTTSTSEQTEARRFLKEAMPDNLFREDFDLVKGELGAYDAAIAERFSYNDRKGGLVVGRPSERGGRNFISANRILERTPKQDWPFFLGQMLVELQEAVDHESIQSREAVEKLIEQNGPDKVFLTLLANPKGTDVAWKYFDTFCDLIPVERMTDLFLLTNARAGSFRAKFDGDPATYGDGVDGVFEYVSFLKKRMTNNDDRITCIRDLCSFVIDEIDSERKIAIYQDVRALYRAMQTGKTPWTFTYGDNTMDLWGLWTKGITEGGRYYKDCSPENLLLNANIIESIQNALSAGPTRVAYLPGIHHVGQEPFVRLRMEYPSGMLRTDISIPLRHDNI